MKLHDTIAAIATPIGTGGIAVLRLSGTDAEKITARAVSPKSGRALEDFESHKLTLCKIHQIDSPDAIIDEGLVAVMRAPHSYTGETVVEINCHGGYYAAGKILEELLKAGARLAEGGEFTRRAFLNGKTDLTGAEAVMDIIDSNSVCGLRNAAQILDGSLAEKINGMRERVMTVAAHISAAADYPEEVDPPNRTELKDNLSDILGDMGSLLNSFDTGRIIRDGITTVIVGRPNVGKSSLLNALSRSDRAIVTDIPGTTRDVIEEYVRIGGISLRLLDTAGIRTGADKVEQIGINRTLEQISAADLCLFILDSTEPISEIDIEISKRLSGKPAIVLLNKTDLTATLSADEVSESLHIPSEHILETAVPPSGRIQGIDALEKTVTDMFIKERMGSGQVYLSNTRQRDSLLKAHSALSCGIESLNSGMPLDLLFVDLEDALSALGEITGVTVREEIIDNVFSRFCVGK